MSVGRPLSSGGALVARLWLRLHARSSNRTRRFPASGSRTGPRANPKRLPKEVFDGLQAQLAANRAQFYYDLPAGPTYGFNRPDVKTLEPVVWRWWRQGTA